jgi:hypothetical protein
MINAIYQRIYLAGYGGFALPRLLRRILAKTQIHRAWFLGFNGYFEQDGTKYGLSNQYSIMEIDRR